VAETEDILLNNPEASFKGILSALNDERNLIRRAEMRRLFEAWRSSGPDVKKLLRDNPELREYVYGEHGVPMWRAVPHLQGTGILIEIQPLSPNREMTREELNRDHTRRLFMHFLMNHLRDQIIGPCARKKCDQYFRRRRKADTKYCSRACAQLQAGSDSADRRRDQERENKMARAQKSMERWAWARTKTRLDWKAFVQQQEPDITPKFLTRAVTQGHLKPPTKGR
jgi:hypothetical protein